MTTKTYKILHENFINFIDIFLIFVYYRKVK